MEPLRTRRFHFYNFHYGLKSRPGELREEYILPTGIYLHWIGLGLCFVGKELSMELQGTWGTMRKKTELEKNDM